MVAPVRCCPAVELAGAPQMPASLLAFAMLARSGPLDAVLLCTPALVPAVDHRLAKASPPPPEAAVFCAGLPRFAMDVEVAVEDPKDCGVDVGIDGRVVENADGVDWLLFIEALTEVK